MATPVISKKQQKSTLSAKKTKNKENIKNVVATPFKNFWPQLSTEHNEVIKQALQEFLPRIKSEKVNVPWNILKNHRKEDRKKIRDEYKIKTEVDSVTTTEKDEIIFGVNAVTKALEKDEISSVLITEDVKPRLMVQHIIDQSVLYDVDVLVVNDLKNILQKVCGIKSITVGIKRESNLKNLVEKIKQLCESYPVPSDHINFNRSMDCVVTNVEKVEKVNKTEQVINEDEIRNKYYLKRSSKLSRVFVPSTNNDAQTIEAGFLSFDDTAKTTSLEILSLKDKAKAKQQYKPLVVKRLKGNRQRVLRKIKLIKNVK